MRNWIDRILFYNPIVLISAGLAIMGCALAGLAFVAWPDAFIGLLTTFCP